MNATGLILVLFALFAYPALMLDIELKSSCEIGWPCVSPDVPLLALALEPPINCGGDEDSCSALMNDRNEKIGAFWRCMVEDPQHSHTPSVGVCVALSTAQGTMSLQTRTTTIAHKAYSHATIDERPITVTTSSTSSPESSANPSLWSGESWKTLFTEPLERMSLHTAGTGGFRWTAGPWINRTSSSFPLATVYATGYLNHTSRPSLSPTVKTEVSGPGLVLATLSEEQPTAFTSLKPTKDVSRTNAAIKANKSSMLIVLLVMALVCAVLL
ncbi:uncharacterized protein TrAtP1_013327 [Trichoderma atroviride]|uniref:uncharacterized protein n=1 Tax=Hypocrea atroviridis TaxID=63577 RepID=UPI00332C1E64|nr:hypothetical protein TrAtP1_013327 [Trichoderma atroviride]